MTPTPSLTIRFIPLLTLLMASLAAPSAFAQPVTDATAPVTAAAEPAAVMAEPATVPAAPAPVTAAAVEQAPAVTAETASAVTAEVRAASELDFSKKRALTGKDLEDKKEGGYFTGLPLINSDPDKGVGYGVRVYYYFNGDREDARFVYTPYIHRLFVQLFQTTNGYQYHTLNIDSPYLFGSAYRLRTVLEYDRNTASNYFGVGAESLGPLWRSDQFESFPSSDAYDEENRKIIGGMSFAKYNQVEIFKPALNMTLERDLFGGVVRPLAGIGISKVSINDYSGDKIEVDDKNAISNTTKLQEDQTAGKIVGFDGGWNNRIMVGAAYDTRDFEPDPNAGMYHELTAAFSNSYLGSENDYERYSTTLRYYYSPITRAADLVIALRGFYQVQTGDIPFFEMSALPFSQGNESGLGGHRSMRGYRQNRFVGPVIAMTNAELRWTVTTFKLGSQQFAPMLVPFLDVGRVFDEIEDTTLQDWKRSGGLGLRIAWNQATIVVIDYGRSPEGSGLYINFNHNF